MKIVCIGDLQGLCYDIDPDMLPAGDILLIAGDLAGWGTQQELIEVNDWLGGLDYKHKIIVAGNHDQWLAINDGHKLFTNAIYLQDELVEVEGLKIYGTPANEMNELRLNNNWAFCDPAYTEKAANDIPDEVDIVLAHGPCYGIQDQLRWNHKSVGSKALRMAILGKRPKVFVCGHIHEAHGVEELWGIKFVNAALCSERNQMFKDDGSLYWEPIVIEL